jgi:hypothetical protein
MERSATAIQSAYRSYSGFESYHLDLIKIITVQQFVRCRTARILLEQKRLKRIVQSAAKTQAAGRGFQVEKEKASFEESLRQSSGNPPRCALGTKVKKVRMILR